MIIKRNGCKDIELNLLDLQRAQWAWAESMEWHNKLPLEYLALIGSEVGEAVNECRGKKPTDLLPDELADIVLRVLDFAEHLHINMEKAIQNKIKKNQTLKRGDKGRIK